MSATIAQYAPAEFLFQPAKKTRDTTLALEEDDIQPSSVGEPETRLWRVAARPTSPRLAIIQLFVLALFFLVALGAMTSCFTELSHLLQSDAVGHVAMKAINGGA